MSFDRLPVFNDSDDEEDEQLVKEEASLFREMSHSLPQSATEADVSASRGKSRAETGAEAAKDGSVLRRVRSSSEPTDSKSSPPRFVNIGWLPERSEELKLSLGGLVAVVALNKDRHSEGISMEDKAWYNTYVRSVALDFLGLSQDEAQGLLQLGTVDADFAPLRALWLDTVSEEDRERAFGELFAQSVLQISTGRSTRYDSRTHICLMRIAKHLDISAECISEYNGLVAELIEESTRTATPAELSETDKAQKSRRRHFRALKVGGAALLGATLVGVTGGLALPALGASLASFGGAAATTGAFIATTGGTALFTTLFTAQGLRLTSYKMSRRYGDLEEFFFREVLDRKHKSKCLTVVICVSGWYNSDKHSQLKELDEETQDQESEGGQYKKETSKPDTSIDSQPSPTTETKPREEDKVEEGQDPGQLKVGPTGPWTSCIQNNRGQLGEPFELVWETKILKDVASVISKFAWNQAVGKAVSETLKTTSLAAIMAAVSWPSMIMSSFDYIDNAWAVAVNRSKLAGEELGRAIVSGAHGQRPASLIGYGLGGLVVFHCLEYIAKRKAAKEDESLTLDGLVLDAYILGAPVTASTLQWSSVRTVVAGSLVNCYAPNDWMLALLFRASTVTLSKIAGLYPVEAKGVINVNLAKADVAHNQVDYAENIDECMQEAIRHVVAQY